MVTVLILVLVLAIIAIVIAFIVGAAWLKSLKDKVLPQLKQEWSEEDESMLQNILECLRHGWKKLPTDILKYESWLESLKERYSWKPSDEQMATFWDAICNLNQDGYKWINDMKSLYYDLKKLRKE